MRTARPGHADAVIDDIVRALGFHPVALRVLEREIAQRHAVAGYQQPFARALLGGEVEHGAIHARAAHGHIVDIEAKTVGQRIAARSEHDLVTRFGEDQRFLQGFLRAFTRRDIMRGGNGGRSACEQRSGNRQSDDHESLPCNL